MNILEKRGTTPEKLVKIMTCVTKVGPTTEKMGIGSKRMSSNVGEQRKNRTLEGAGEKSED